MTPQSSAAARVGYPIRMNATGVARAHLGSRVVGPSPRRGVVSAAVRFPAWSCAPAWSCTRARSCTRVTSSQGRLR